jgi:hypothetical protein
MAKGTVPAAKRAVKNFVAIPSQNVVFRKTGYSFRFLIKKEDAPVQVMGDDPFLEIVKNPFQIFSIGDYFIEQQRGHFDFV